MKAWTWAEISTKVRRDLDIQEEDFVSDEELLGYMNEAIDVAEAIIHNLWEDYFLDSATISLVAGQSEYDLPADIYAQKIRHLQYDYGNDYYKITELDLHRIADITSSATGIDRMFYKLTNNATNGIKLRLFPTPQESQTNAITLWYYRNAKEITVDADVIDIPEFINYLMQYIKVRVYEKDLGSPNRGKAIMDLASERDLMVETLSVRIADGVRPLEIDMSFYEDHS